jgi:hypothetical protein
LPCSEPFCHFRYRKWIEPPFQRSGFAEIGSAVQNEKEAYMNANPHVQALRMKPASRAQHCILCGKRPGYVLFKGQPVCQSCLAYTKELS